MMDICERGSCANMVSLGLLKFYLLAKRTRQLSKKLIFTFIIKLVFLSIEDERYMFYFIVPDLYI